MSIEKPYQPSEEEMNKAKEMMTDEEKETSKGREIKIENQELSDKIEMIESDFIGCPQFALYQIEAMEKEGIEVEENNIVRIIDDFYGKKFGTTDEQCDHLFRYNILRKIDNDGKFEKMMNEKIKEVALSHNEKLKEFIDQQLQSIEALHKEGMDNIELEHLLEGMSSLIYSHVKGIYKKKGEKRIDEKYAKKREEGIDEKF